MSDAKSPVTVKKTLVEEGTQFKGSMSSTCPVEVKGRIEGNVEAPSLTVSGTGAVHGKVAVGELRSQGEIAGEFDADLVHLSGVVRDNTVLRAKSLEVKLAQPNGKMQVIFGECVLDVGEMPSKEAAASPEKSDAKKEDAKEVARAADAEAKPSRSVPPPAERKSLPPPEANGAGMA